MLISRSWVILTRPGYKMPEIGEIPEEWETVTMNEVGQYINGMAFKPRDWKEHGIPIVRIENLNDSDASFHYYQGKFDKRYLLNDGELLLSWSASLGVYLWNRGEALLNQHIFKVIPKENISKHYLYWALHRAVDTLSRATHGSTMKHFQKGELEKTLIPLPPLPEQQKIAEILSTADEAIQKVNEQITRTEQLKKGLMRTLLTRGIGHTKFKMTEVGEIPEEWRNTPVRDIVSVKRGYSYRSDQITRDKPTSIRIININDFDKISGWKQSPEILYLTSSVIPSKFKLHPNELLIANTDMSKGLIIGAPLLIDRIPEDTSYIFSSDLTKLTPLNSSVNTKFLFYFLSYEPIRKATQSYAQGTNVLHLNHDLFKQISIPIPTLTEQQKIAEILSTADEKLGLLRKKSIELEILKKGLMEDLLTGKIRVKV